MNKNGSVSRNKGPLCHLTQYIYYYHYYYYYYYYCHYYPNNDTNKYIVLSDTMDFCFGLLNRFYSIIVIIIDRLVGIVLSMSDY